MGIYHFVVLYQFAIIHCEESRTEHSKRTMAPREEENATVSGEDISSALSHHIIFSSGMPLILGQRYGWELASLLRKMVWLCMHPWPSRSVNDKIRTGTSLPLDVKDVSSSNIQIASSWAELIAAAWDEAFECWHHMEKQPSNKHWYKFHSLNEVRAWTRVNPSRKYPAGEASSCATQGKLFTRREWCWTSLRSWGRGIRRARPKLLG
jgi:hypothetical protein